MSEADIAYRITHRLDQGAEELPQATRERLFAARQQALARQKRTSALLSLPGFGHLAHNVLLPRLGTLASVVIMAATVAGSYYWNIAQQVAENEDLDTALLSDDLPPNAYLDHGFDAWLKSDGSSKPR